MPSNGKAALQSTFGETLCECNLQKLFYWRTIRSKTHFWPIWLNSTTLAIWIELKKLIKKWDFRRTPILLNPSEMADFNCGFVTAKIKWFYRNHMLSLGLLYVSTEEIKHFIIWDVQECRLINMDFHNFGAKGLMKSTWKEAHKLKPSKLNLKWKFGMNRQRLLLKTERLLWLEKSSDFK